MSHKHEWIKSRNWNRNWAQCKDCHELLEWESVLARLNATEELTAEMAEDILAWEGGASGHIMNMAAWNALRVYASKMGGKHERKSVLGEAQRNG